MKDALTGESPKPAGASGSRKDNRHGGRGWEETQGAEVGMGGGGDVQAKL